MQSNLQYLELPSSKYILDPPCFYFADIIPEIFTASHKGETACAPNRGPLGNDVLPMSRIQHQLNVIYTLNLTDGS
jgi:hypothetical protein